MTKHVTTVEWWVNESCTCMLSRIVMETKQPSNDSDVHSQLFSVKNLRRSSSESPDFQALDHEIFWRRQQVVVVRHTPLRASMIQVTVKPQAIDAPVTTHRHTQGHVVHGSALYIGSKPIHNLLITDQILVKTIQIKTTVQTKQPNNSTSFFDCLLLKPSTRI